VVVVNAEAFRAPLRYRPFAGIPAVYDVLRTVPGAVVVELPVYDRRIWAGNATYMVNSTRHWKPLVNGYSGFVPAGYARLQPLLRGFPDQDALDTMHRRGITHAVVHEAAFVAERGRPAFDEIASIQSLQEIARDGDIRIYRLR
jgi:hypothetical protein